MRIIVDEFGIIFDVTASVYLYGPGGIFDEFRGRDASRALITLSGDKITTLDEFDQLLMLDVRRIYEGEILTVNFTYTMLFDDAKKRRSYQIKSKLGEPDSFLSTISDGDKKILGIYETQFRAKYPVVGRLID